MLMAHRLVTEVPMGFSRAEQLRKRPNITSVSFRATRRGARQARPPLPGAAKLRACKGTIPWQPPFPGRWTVRSRLDSNTDFPILLLHLEKSVQSNCERRKPQGERVRSRHPIPESSRPQFAPAPQNTMNGRGQLLDSSKSHVEQVVGDPCDEYNRRLVKAFAAQTVSLRCPSDRQIHWDS